MFNAFIDYWYYTGDNQYNPLITQALQHQMGEAKDSMPSNQTKSLGNDDQAFWGMQPCPPRRMAYQTWQMGNRHGFDIK
jgi:hypothetical protein